MPPASPPRRGSPRAALAFFATALTIWTAMHAYVYVRLVLVPALPSPVASAAALLLLAGALTIFPAFARNLPQPWAGRVHLVAFTWMGVVFLLDALLLVGDMGRGLAALVTALPPDAGRWQAIATLAAGLPLAAFALYQGRRDAPLVRVRIHPAGWPPALDGLTIVQLSDVHVSPDTHPAEIHRLVARVNALAPDLVVLTGDMVDGPPALLAPAVAPLAGLRARLGVYAVTGNHEYYSDADAWIAAFTALGIRTLHNEHVAIAAHGSAFTLAGVPDWMGGRFGPSHQPRLADALAGRDPALPVLLLAHQPRQFPEATTHGVALQLSGHTHGGQLWPFMFLVRLQERHMAGLHREGEAQIYVSRGTRYWGPPMRLGAPHELTLLTLTTSP